jgi:hypothetical protein
VTVHLSVHQGGGRPGLYRARITQVADAATALVAEHMGGRMPPVRVVFTSGSGMTALRSRADKDFIIAADPAASRQIKGDGYGGSAASDLGATVLDGRGALVLINTPRQRNLRDLDETLVHELAHAVQMTAPAVRESHLAFLRQQYRIVPRDAAWRTYLRQADRREAEAVSLERLARRLPAPTES